MSDIFKTIVVIDGEILGVEIIEDVQIVKVRTSQDAMMDGQKAQVIIYPKSI